jgi:hypothetical protein
VVGGSPRLDMAGCRQGWEPDIPRKLLCGSYQGRDDYGCRPGYAFGTDWNTGFRIGQEEGRGDRLSRVKCPSQDGACVTKVVLPLFHSTSIPGVLAFCFGDRGRHACVGVDIILLCLVVAFSRRLYCILRPRTILRRLGDFLTIYEHCRTCIPYNSP